MSANQTPNEEAIQEQKELALFIISIMQEDVNMNIIETAKRNDNSVLTFQAKQLVAMAYKLSDKILERYFGEG